MILSVASGKGGTGKTTLSLLLAAARENVIIVDCDVEEPNCHLFLKPSQTKEHKVMVKIPACNESLCNACNRCVDVCMFNAIAMPLRAPMFFPELCHSCGGCMVVCPQRAIYEKEYEVGKVVQSDSLILPKTSLWYGELNVGAVSGVPIIKHLKTILLDIDSSKENVSKWKLKANVKIKKRQRDFIIDSPPGTACSMVAAVRDSDACILVTEPSAFGLHDLELAMKVTQLLKIPSGVVINRSISEAGNADVVRLCEKYQIPLVAAIPYSYSFAKFYANGGFADEEMKRYARKVWQWLDKVGGGKQ